MPKVQIKDGPEIDFPDSMSGEEIAAVVRRKFSPKATTPAATPTPNAGIAAPRADVLSQPAKKPDTDALSKIGTGALGITEHIGGGFAKTAADFPLQIAKLGTGLAMRTGQMFDEFGQKNLGSLITGKNTPSDFTRSMRSATDILEDAQALNQKQIEGYMGTPDVSLELGPVKLGVGETIGSMLPFAAAGILAGAAKTGVAQSTVQTIIKSMKGAAGFSAIYEAPNIIAAHSGAEALERAKQAGINIGVGTLMAGVFPAVGRGLKWAKEGLTGKPYVEPKSYAEPADRVFPQDVELNATGQVLLEKGVPNTMNLGADQPIVTPMDHAHAAEIKADIKAKTDRLKANLPKIGLPVERRGTAMLNDLGEDIRHTLPGYKGPERRGVAEPNLKIEEGIPGLETLTTEDLSAAYRKAKETGNKAESDRLKILLKERFEKGEIEAPKVEPKTETVEGLSPQTPEGFYKPGNVIEGLTSKTSKERVVSFKPGTEENRGRWTAVLEDVKTGKKRITDRVPWDETAVPQSEKPRSKEDGTNFTTREEAIAALRREGELPGAGAPPKSPPPPPSSPPPSSSTPPPPVGPPFPPTSKVPALKRVGRAFEDAIAGFKALSRDVQDLPDPTKMKALEDRYLHNDKMTLAIKAKELEAGTRAILSDIQGAIAPMSKLNGYAEKRPFFNYEGVKTYLEQVWLPGFREAALEKTTLHDRELVTLIRDTRGNVQQVLDAAGPRLKRINQILDVYKPFLEELRRAGVEGDLFSPEAVRDNFIPRIYGFRAGAVREFLAKRRPLDAANPHSMGRVFDDLIAAEKEGFRMPTLDVVELVEAYARSLVDTLKNHQLVKDVVEKIPGRVAWIKEGELPRGSDMRPLDERISAGKRETMVLDKNNKPTGELIEERLYADPALHQLLSNVMDPSALTQSPTMKAVAKANSAYKAIMLSLDVYHMATIWRQAFALHGTGLSWTKGLEMLAQSSEKHGLVKELIANGLDLGHAPDWSKRAFIQDIQRLETTNKAAKFVKESVPGRMYEAFNKQLWDKMHKGLKTFTAVGEFQKYINDPKMLEKYSRAELANRAAEFANDVYGGQAWASHGRSQTFESVSRLLLLAPDWFETRMNLAASALKRGPEGNSARGYWFGFLGETAAFSLAANAIMQKIDPKLKDHPSVAGVKSLMNIAIPVYDGQGHPLVLGMGGAFQYVYDFMHDAGKTLHNREAALLRAGFEFWTQRDWTDKRIAPSLTSKENWVHLGKNLVPVPLVVQFMDIEWDAAGASWSRTKMDMAKSLLRSLGTHPSSGYPQELRQDYNYLVDRRDTVMRKIRVINENGTILGIGTKTGMIREEARKYNEDVKKLIASCAKTYRGNEVGKKVEKLFITGEGK